MNVIELVEGSRRTWCCPHCNHFADLGHAYWHLYRCVRRYMRADAGLVPDLLPLKTAHRTEQEGSLDG